MNELHASEFSSLLLYYKWNIYYKYYNEYQIYNFLEIYSENKYPDPISFCRSIKCKMKM